MKNLHQFLPSPKGYEEELKTLKDTSTRVKDIVESDKSSNTGSDHDSTECEQDMEEYTAEVNNPQCSIDESTISAYDISRAVQLKKTRCLTDIEKLNYFNNHSIPASNFKFPTK